jgi:tRNA(Arg) A34 adenosine deaminase TadA
MNIDKKEKIMQIAIEEAKKGILESNAPFGAVVVDEN